MSSPTPTVRPNDLPLFQLQTLRKDTTDAFWISPFPTRPPNVANNVTLPAPATNLVAFGLGTENQSSKIEMFTNPYSILADIPPIWTSNIIAELSSPVSMDHAEIAGTGLNDLIVAHVSDAEGSGTVSWLKNSGDTADLWMVHTIGNTPGMLRVKAGQFSTNDNLQIVAVPVNFDTPAPIIIYTKPDDPTKLWASTLVETTQEYIPRDLFVVTSPSGDPRIPFDQIVLASQDGIDVLWFDGQTWQNFHVVDGLVQQPGNLTWGARSVSVGRVGSDFAGLVCSSEGLHGNLVCAYTKASGSPPGIVDNTWTRTILDDFGEGSIRHVVCADIDGDGVDEFLVAMIGTDPPELNMTGVWAYKFNQDNQTFTKTKLHNDPTVCIAAATLRPNSGGMDFATTGPLDSANVSSGRSITVHLPTGILVERLDQEVLFRIVDPRNACFTSVMPFVEVNGVRLSLVVVPPGELVLSDIVPGLIGAKVLSGSLTFADGSVRTNAIRPLQTASLVMPRTSCCMGGTVFAMSRSPTADSQTSGAVSQPTSANIFPADAPADVRALKFPWVRVQGRSKTSDPAQAPPIDFFRLVGFHVHLASDTLAKICRFELTATGAGTSTGFDNCLDESMCEIRACIVNGTGDAGMRHATVDDSAFDPDNPNLLDTALVRVKTLEEHGALWRTTRDGLPRLRANNTIDYPWNSWLAGNTPGQDSVFDVFATFQFPSFMTFASTPSSVFIPEDEYVIQVANPSPIAGSVLALQEPNPTNLNTPAIVLRAIPSEPNSKWKISAVLGTDMYEISHLDTGLLLGSRWPPFNGQHAVGLRKPAALGLTTRFSLAQDGRGHFTFRVMSQADGDVGLFLAPGLPTLPPGGVPHPLSDLFAVFGQDFGGLDTPSWSLVRVSS